MKNVLTSKMGKLATAGAMSVASLAAVGGSTLALAPSASAATTYYHWYQVQSNKDSVCNAASMRLDLTNPVHRTMRWTRINWYTDNTFWGFKTGGQHVGLCKVLYQAHTPYAGGSMVSDSVGYNWWNQSSNRAGVGLTVSR